MNTLPQYILDKLQDYPAIAHTLAPVYNKPSLPTNYKPKIIEVFCDQKLALQYINGYITYQVFVDESYVPQTIEWAIDGEMVWVLVQGETILNRLENLISMIDVNTN